MDGHTRQFIGASNPTHGYAACSPGFIQKTAPSVTLRPCSKLQVPKEILRGAAANSVLICCTLLSMLKLFQHKRGHSASKTIPAPSPDHRWYVVAVRAPVCWADRQERIIGCLRPTAASREKARLRLNFCMCQQQLHALTTERIAEKSRRQPNQTAYLFETRAAKASPPRSCCRIWYRCSRQPVAATLPSDTQ